LSKFLYVGAATAALTGLGATAAAAQPSATPATAAAAAAAAARQHEVAVWKNTVRWNNTARWNETVRHNNAVRWTNAVRRNNVLRWTNVVRWSIAARRANATRAAAASRAPAVHAAPATGACGGDLPPCYVMMRESRGSLTARNPSSSASGKWQFIDSTWAGFGGYAHAYLAPESVQDARARAIWAHGAGCSAWSAC